jgi:hypothetical protein
MKTSDIVTLCSAIVALSGAISEPMLDTLTHGHGAYASTILAVAAIVAGVVIRTLSSPAGAPATSVVADAPVVPQGTTVTTPQTPVVGTAVSTTSTQPIAAPQKGTQP